MSDAISLDGRTLVGIGNDDGGDVSEKTLFHFEQENDQIRASYSGGVIVEGYLVGIIDRDRWNIRYVQLTENGETATGHSVGVVKLLDDGRVRVEDEWEWESKDGSGTSTLEEITS